MPNGYELVEEYKHSLLAYWEGGHGEMLVLISELQGFLDCLIRLGLSELPSTEAGWHHKV